MTISRKICRLLPVLLAGAASVAAWKVAQPGYPWSFPRDHWAHPEFRTEWWYFTGILRDVDDSSRRFGYQFTVFRVGVLPEPTTSSSQWATRQLFMGHAAVGDFESGSHRFSDLLYREMPLLSGFGTYPDTRLAWSRAPAGTPGEWNLTWNGAAFDFRMRDDERGAAFELSTRPLKDLVLEGPGGLSRKSNEAGAASLYYSFPRLDTFGTLTVDGKVHRVRGTSWMDKEFSSSQLRSDQVGWDWLGLRLADGRDIMLYILRDRRGAADFGKGTLVSAGGKSKYLSAAEWSLRPTGTWTSGHTGARYPSRWVLEIPGEGLKLEIRPILEDQENVCRRSASPYYWEGAVKVLGPGGVDAGEGYVELTGYGENNRPPL